ncbi:hypothetical protein [Duganella sp. Dugasp56]|uniref:hypothetical protein n=1 Tax=Duganella sp. Dugasp56 TaxID=3243046 RepID=UPI0039B09DC2
MQYNTVVTDANGGNHAPHQTKMTWDWIDNCAETYHSPRLYHIVLNNLPDLVGWASYSMQKAVLKDLMQHLRRKKLKASFRSGREIDDSPKGKGEHLHIFICIESHLFNPDHILNMKKDGWLVKYAAQRGIHVYVNPPKNEIHSGRNYMSLPLSKPYKIDDAKQWASYLHKIRTKPTGGEVYSCSRSNRTYH